MDKTQTSGTAEAIILVPAALQQSRKQEATLYALAITPEGEFVRIYPVTYRKGRAVQQFKRWERIRFSWTKSTDDPRPESWRIDPATVEVLGEFPSVKRAGFLVDYEVTELKMPMEQSWSIVLLRPRKAMFSVKRKSREELAVEKQANEKVAQFLSTAGVNAPKLEEPFPYKFVYRYWTDSGEYEGMVQDWDMRQTFLNLAKSYGEPRALARIIQLWGKDYLRKGVLFAMSRESLKDTTWMINAVLCHEEADELKARAYDLLA